MNKRKTVGVIGIITALVVTALATGFSSTFASILWFYQPETPKCLVK